MLIILINYFELVTESRAVQKFVFFLTENPYFYFPAKCMYKFLYVEEFPCISIIITALRKNGVGWGQVTLDS